MDPQFNQILRPPKQSHLVGEYLDSENIKNIRWLAKSKKRFEFGGKVSVLQLFSHGPLLSSKLFLSVSESDSVIALDSRSQNVACIAARGYHIPNQP
ncbi:hypothetical protein TNCT_313681 [Trichonephila clavata]|uniref:Uncharacterized protein n=1 Tax=Trichonephila clavata TaxID=2740835 RepID=A0A8X6K544_TRICU|nr:hypothetical protein TNCT_313681 [Trichonephila clavata]